MEKDQDNKCDFCDAPCGNDWCPTKTEAEETDQPSAEDRLKELTKGIP